MADFVERMLLIQFKRHDISCKQYFIELVEHKKERDLTIKKMCQDNNISSLNMYLSLTYGLPYPSNELMTCQTISIIDETKVRKLIHQLYIA